MCKFIQERVRVLLIPIFSGYGKWENHSNTHAYIRKISMCRCTHFGKKQKKTYVFHEEMCANVWCVMYTVLVFQRMCIMT